MQRPPARARPWQVGDRTGGPLDEVLDALRQQHPDLVVERLTTTHPTDDDNVFFFGFGQIHNVVQVDTGPAGQPPFSIEADDRVDTAQPAEALVAIQTRLHQARTSHRDRLPRTGS